MWYVVIDTTNFVSLLLLYSTEVFARGWARLSFTNLTRGPDSVRSRILPVHFLS
jgi:hypothetical protein